MAGRCPGREAAFGKGKNSICSWKEQWLLSRRLTWQLHEWWKRRCASADNPLDSIKTATLQKNAQMEEIIIHTHAEARANTHTHTETKSETHWQRLLLLEYTYFKKVKTNWKENRHNGGNSNSLSNRCRLRVNTESLRCFITAASKAIIIPRSALRLQVAASWWIGSKLFLHKESRALNSRQFQFGASILTTNSPNLVNKL